jgi:hypothetical protein
MKTVVLVVVVLGVGVALGRMFDGAPPAAEAGGGRGAGVEGCAARNGDVNADGRVDLSYRPCALLQPSSRSNQLQPRRWPGSRPGSYNGRGNPRERRPGKAATDRALPRS